MDLFKVTQTLCISHTTQIISMPFTPFCLLELSPLQHPAQGSTLSIPINCLRAPWPSLPLIPQDSYGQQNSLTLTSTHKVLQPSVILSELESRVSLRPKPLESRSYATCMISVPNATYLCRTEIIIRTQK